MATLALGAGRQGGTEEAELFTQAETTAADLEDIAVVFARFPDRVQPGINAAATGFYAKSVDDLFWVIFAKLAEFDFTLLGVCGFFQIGADFAEILNF